ncbi:MAG: hypothetical protein GY679_01255 [Mycoplasma sp.]|nr:hypothetical protein [Mycoplasma sp.]
MNCVDVFGKEIKDGDIVAYIENGRREEGQHLNTGIARNVSFFSLTINKENYEGCEVVVKQ